MFQSCENRGDGNVAIFPAMTDGGDSSHCDVKGGIVSEATGFDNLHPFAKVVSEERKLEQGAHGLTVSSRINCP